MGLTASLFSCTLFVLSNAFPALLQTVAHPYFGEFMLRLSVALRPLFEPLVLSIVPRGELPPLSVADVFSIHPDALTGTIRSIGEIRVGTDKTVHFCEYIYNKDINHSLCFPLFLYTLDIHKHVYGSACFHCSSRPRRPNSSAAASKRTTRESFSRNG